VGAADVEAAVRRVVFATLAATGAAPSPAAIAAELGRPPGEVSAALHSLHAAHQLVLTPAGDAVRMAHPFSAAPMGFVLRAPHDDRMWWGGCAWDSFGIVAALGEELEIATRCPHCGRALAFVAGPGTPPPDLTVRLPRPAAEWWDDVVWTCARIRLFCDEQHARAYVAAHGLPEGALVPARTMWRLAQGWYGDRLDPGYRPQTRQERQEQLAALGLTGDFWRLP
jgi:hypothetical protein